MTSSHIILKTKIKIKSFYFIGWVIYSEIYNYVHTKRGRGYNPRQRGAGLASIEM